MTTLPDTLMRFALCSHCGHRDRVADDADGVPRMCNGCGGFGTNRFIGVTEPALADQLRAEFPEPTVDEIGRPVVKEPERCRFHTTRPLGALSQPARRRKGSAGRSATRYHQCKNTATTSVTITRHNLRGSTEVEVPCCALHARLHAERGLLP